LEPRVVVLELAQPSPASSSPSPSFVRAEVLPDRGMMTLQITAMLPELGLTDLLDAPPRSSLAGYFGDAGDPYGNRSFSTGGAILVPYANRVPLATTGVLGSNVSLPANGGRTTTTGEPFAIHGLILATPARIVESHTTAEEASVRASIDAGDFGCGWPSDARIKVTYVLRASSLTLEVVVDNAGEAVLPLGIGWHPYFRLPSGDRTQARVHVPALARAVVDNDVDVLPTGEVIAIDGTDHDLAVVGGRALGDQFFDDCFIDIVRTSDGNAVAEIFDPAAGYGLRIIGESPAINAFQVFAPPAKPYVVVEPQYNLADPFGTAWPATVDTGMVSIAPGGSTTYSVRLELI
jgi:aldose 1-epimerase